MMQKTPPHIQYAVYLLEKRDYSEQELFQKITGKYSEQQAASAVAYCVEKGYVNDEKYARRLIEKYLARYGEKRVRQELYQRGISRELSGRLLEESYDPETEYAKICALLRVKCKGALPADRKEYEKVYAFLVRKGYSPDEISHAVSQYREEIK